MKEKESCIHHTASDSYGCRPWYLRFAVTYIVISRSWAIYPARCHGQQHHNSAPNTWISWVTSFTLFSMPFRDPNTLLSLSYVHTNLSSERLSPALVFFKNSLLPPSANKTVLTERAVNKLLTTSAEQESSLHPKPRSDWKKQCLSEQGRGEPPQKAFPHPVIYSRVY